jgi:hypothetical protein
MSLENWAANGWLRPEQTSRDEIKNLLSIVNRDIDDAMIAEVSEDRRFEAAYNAARTVANIALRANGYRVPPQPGHHTRTIESLEFTLKVPSAMILRLKAFSKKRNATSYDSAGNVSEQELNLAIRTAKELRNQLSEWLRDKHPELL